MEQTKKKKRKEPVCRHSSSRTQWTGHRDRAVSPFGVSSRPSSLILLKSPASHYGTDATVFGLGSASSRTRRLAVMVWNMLGVVGMLTVVAVLWVRVLVRV